MTHNQCVDHASSAGPDTATVRAGQISAQLANSQIGGAIFEESELKAMRQVLDSLCRKMRIHPDSDDARRSALAIVRHAAAGVTDSNKLAEAVEAELMADRQMSDA